MPLNIYFPISVLDMLCKKREFPRLPFVVKKSQLISLLKGRLTQKPHHIFICSIYLGNPVYLHLNPSLKTTSICSQQAHFHKPRYWTSVHGQTAEGQHLHTMQRRLLLSLVKRLFVAKRQNFQYSSRISYSRFSRCS